HLLGLDKSYKPILETSLNAHDGLTTVSYWMKEFILKNYNISTDINVIYNFVDTEKFSVKPKKKYKDKVVFCHVSNFREVKRSPDIVKAFAKVAKKHENIRLEMIGSGPELGYCRDLTISHGLQDKIIFHGSLLNVPEILCHTDVFIIPSARESFGLAALEAMACEIPVISSNAGGLPEVIEDGNAGFQVEPGNIQQLVKYISLLVEDDKLRVKLAKEARKIATTKFHPDKIIPQYENLYREILEKK
ncbi:MAG: glycosyltransferase, partial [Asgard group archaeon]|nr:glycosyltransferase [Asgard group archaeon]